MRQDPLVTSWVIRCESEQEARALQSWLEDHLTFEPDFIEEVRARPCGAEARWLDVHRLADYFADIRMLTGPPTAPSSFRVVFRRREGATPFWKDVMVRILQKLRSLSPNTSVRMDYRGDEELRQAE
jgi:hypothetical protein